MKTIPKLSRNGHGDKFRIFISSRPMPRRSLLTDALRAQVDRVILPISNGHCDGNFRIEIAIPKPSRWCFTDPVLVARIDVLIQSSKVGVTQLSFFSSSKVGISKMLMKNADEEKKQSICSVP